jgi:hypothetical protein
VRNYWEFDGSTMKTSKEHFENKKEIKHPHVATKEKKT